MERVCEFCVTIRSVIYCKADSAHLCLSCDFKVHLANPLSNRHPRNLICESCKCRTACVRCFDHDMFMCRGCDRSHHDTSLRHRKRTLSCYTGCPSAQDLASLWGFNLNSSAAAAESDLRGKFGPSSSACDSGSRVLAFGDAPNSGSTSRDTKACYGGMQRENSLSILQQLLDLERLQLSGDCETTPFVPYQVKNSGSSSNLESPWKLGHSHDQQAQQLTTLFDAESPHHEPSLEPYHPFPFSQLGQLATSSTDGSALQGDSFLQCKSPAHSGQLWSQNMQDLGVCEELACSDDLNIPDVDLTFRNFEELFRSEQEPIGMLLVNKGTTSMENDTSGRSYAKAMEDTSVDTDTSVCAAQLINQCMGRLKRALRTSRNEDQPYQVSESYSASSFSISRISDESHSTDDMDIGLSRNSPDLGSEARGDIVTRNKEKDMDIQRNDKQQAQCGYRKARSNLGKRVKSRVWKAEGFKTGDINVDITRSF